MNQKAQALISVFLLLIIAGIFVGVLGRLWPAEMQTRQYEKQGLKTFYLAHGALELGKAAAKKYPALSGWYPCLDDSNPNCWYHDSSNGWYKASILNLGGNRRKIVSRAQEMDPSSSPARILTQRKLEVTIDIGTGLEEEWSWREECPTCVSAPPPPPPSPPPPLPPPPPSSSCAGFVYVEPDQGGCGIGCPPGAPVRTCGPTELCVRWPCQPITDLSGWTCNSAPGDCPP